MSARAVSVALRADASAASGLGHVTRCLALAQALQRTGAHPLLVTRERGAGTRQRASHVGVECIELDPSLSNASDAAATLHALHDREVDWVLVDDYVLAAPWHRAVAAGCGARIAAVDDLADRPLAAELVIDHNCSADHAAKYAGRIGAATQLLGGPRFALIGPTFASARTNAVEDPVRSIGIFLGGTDPAGLSDIAIEACRVYAGFDGAIEVVTSSANPRLAALRERCNRNRGVSLTVDLPDLAAFFGRHGLHIGAGGGASWERCCIGAPTLGLICAPNQRMVIPALSSLGALATPEPVTAIDAAAIGAAVSALLADAPRRRALGDQARKLVDGRGAERVALALNADALVLRPAVAADAALAWRWRNDESTRRTALDNAAIPWPAHEAWWACALADPARRLLIGMVGAVPVGVIRFDLAAGGGGPATVSLYLDPALHYLGLGPRLLAAGERHMLDVAGGFAATVLADNPASQRLFAGAGYMQYSATGWRKPGAAATHAGGPRP